MIKLKQIIWCLGITHFFLMLINGKIVFEDELLQSCKRRKHKKLSKFIEPLLAEILSFIQLTLDYVTISIHQFSVTVVYPRKRGC